MARTLRSLVERAKGAALANVVVAGSEVATATLGLVAFVLTLAALSPVVIAIAIVLALVGVAVTHMIASRLAGVPIVGPVATQMAGRILVLAAVALAAARETPKAQGVAVGTLLVGFVIVAEPILAFLDQATIPVSANLGGEPSAKTLRVPSRVAFYFTSGSVAAAAALAGGRAPAWMWIALGVAALCPWLVVTVSAIRIVLIRYQLERGLVRRLRALKPTFVLHWEAPQGTQSAYQVEMWLPYLKQLGKPFFVLVRTPQNFQEICDIAGDVPVVLRKQMEDLDAVMVSSLKSVFYVNTAVRNGHLIRYTNLDHIQLNHGDSDKAPSYNRAFRVFTKNLVAGQAAVDRFAAHGVTMPPDVLEIVGRPQVASIERATGPISNARIPTVLYAPTWAGFYAGADYSSLPIGIELVRCLVARGCTVIFRPHPFARKSRRYADMCDDIIEFLTADHEKNGTEHVYGERAEVEFGIVDCFNHSDALIADISSVPNDYLFSEKPIAICAVLDKAGAEFEMNYPIARASYVIDAHRGRLEAPEAALDKMLGQDPLRTQRRELKTYYLGDIPSDHYVERFLSVAGRYV